MEVASRPVLWMFGNSWAKVLKLSTHGICWSTQILSQVIQELQVNLCQKLSFFCIYYRIHNMASDCSLDYKEKHVQHMLCTQIVFNVKTKHNMCWACIIFVKFIYSAKATKFCEISTLLLSYVVPVKSKVEISQIFVAFSEYMNFNSMKNLL